MSAIALEHASPRLSLDRLRAASPLLWWTSLAFLMFFVLCSGLSVVDPRLLNGIGVWIKPAKFFLSLSLHMLTLCFGLTLLPERVRSARAAGSVWWLEADLADKDAILKLHNTCIGAANGQGYGHVMVGAWSQ